MFPLGPVPRHADWLEYVQTPHTESELAANYPPGARIANVPTQAAGSGHANAGFAGQQLRGTTILEVPVQNGPIPQSVINAANRQGIVIRDINGRVYNP
jgi:hypothetical protein